MSQISINNLTFHYEGSYDNIFENSTFRIDTDWKLGFIGRNGRGKTTFLNILLGKYEYQGSITSSEHFDYFPYSLSTEQKEKNTIDIIEEIDPGYELWIICRELSLLQIEADILYRPFFTLSNGEQTKVMLAVLFSKEHNFLLIDEPTNHLDAKARVSVKDYLSKKKGFILVSHDKWFLDACVDHVLVINKNSIEVEKGNFSTWWENKKRQDEFEIGENEKLKKDIKKLTESARQSAKWADKVESTKIGYNPIKEQRDIGTRSYIGEKSRRMQQRRKNLERRQEGAIQEKAKLLKNIESTETLKIIPLSYHKELLVSAKNLTISFGNTKVVEQFQFTINRGERIILHGKNGCGKSTIIKCILGQIEDYQGEFQKASGLKISYISQDTSFLKGSLADYAREQEISDSLFRAILRKLDLERVQFEKNMESYSEGQKKKVLIAKSLCEQAHLYIWDEPLNFIDIFSRMQIEQLILQFQPTMLIVEHDKSFTTQIGTRIIDMNEFE